VNRRLSARDRAVARGRAVINQRGGGGARLLDQLDAEALARYEAQFELWSAGRALAVACHLNHEYGVPVPHETVARWENAHAVWERRHG
jgi:hypothetical protein